MKLRNDNEISDISIYLNLPDENEVEDGRLPEICVSLPDEFEVLYVDMFNLFFQEADSKENAETLAIWLDKAASIVRSKYK